MLHRVLYCESIDLSGYIDAAVWCYAATSGRQRSGVPDRLEGARTNDTMANSLLPGTNLAPPCLHPVWFRARGSYARAKRAPSAQVPKARKPFARTQWPIAPYPRSEHLRHNARLAHACETRCLGRLPSKHLVTFRRSASCPVWQARCQGTTLWIKGNIWHVAPA